VFNHLKHKRETCRMPSPDDDRYQENVTVYQKFVDKINLFKTSKLEVPKNELAPLFREMVDAVSTACAISPGTNSRGHI
jgi:hypothetical protein